MKTKGPTGPVSTVLQERIGERPSEGATGVDKGPTAPVERDVFQAARPTLSEPKLAGIAPGQESGALAALHGGRRAIVGGILSLLERHAGVESALRGRGLTRSRRGELREVRQNLRRALNFKDGQLQRVALDDGSVEAGTARMAAYLDDCEELARAQLKVVYGLDPSSGSPREEALSAFFAAFERDNPVGMLGARQFSRPSPQLLYCGGVYKTLQLLEEGASVEEIRKRLDNIVTSGNAESASGPLGAGLDMNALLDRAAVLGEAIYPRLKFAAKVQRVIGGLNSQEGGVGVELDKNSVAEERLLKAFRALDGLRFAGSYSEEMLVIKELVESCSVREGLPGADDILPVLVEVIKVDSEGAARLRKIVKASGDAATGAGVDAYLLSTLEVALAQAAVELKKEK